MGFENKEQIIIKQADSKMPSVLVLSRSEAICADVAQVLTATSKLKVESQVLDLSDAARPLDDFPRTDFIVLDVGAGSLEEVSLIERLGGKQNKALPPIVALIDRGSELGSVRAMRAGAVDVLLRPLLAEEAGEVFQRLSALPNVTRLPARRAALGKAIAFLHVSGGAGATTLAVNTAAALTSVSGKEGACLVDLDIQFGAAGSLLDLSRTSRLEDFLSDPSRLDGEMLETLAVLHKSGLRVLTAPRQPAPLHALDEGGVLHLLGVAKRKYAFTIVDLPVSVTSWTTSVLQSADVIYLVCELSVPSAHRTRRFLELLHSEGISRLPIKVVANRQGAKVGGGNEVTLSRFEKAIGRKVDYSIPNEYSLISLSHSQGRAAIELKPKSGFSKALRHMLSRELGDDLFTENAPSRFFFGRKRD